MTECPLCNLERRTHRYFESSSWIICDCVTCRVPMVVYCEHMASEEDIGEDKVGDIVDIAQTMFPDRRPDFEMRSFPEHFHFHMR